MTANLRAVPSLAPVAQVVSVCERLLAMARTGELRGVAVAGEVVQREVLTVVAHDATPALLPMIGALHHLAAKLERELES